MLFPLSSSVTIRTSKPSWKIHDTTADWQDGVWFFRSIILLSSIALISRIRQAHAHLENHDLLPLLKEKMTQEPEVQDLGSTRVAGVQLALVLEAICQTTFLRTWCSYFVTVKKDIKLQRDLDVKNPLIWLLSLENRTFYIHGQIYIFNTVLLRKNVLELYHDDPLAGHFGAERAKYLTIQSFLAGDDQRC